MDGWQAETVFSSMKRMFGEYIYVSARKYPNMVNEMILKKGPLYNNMFG
jgi:hypothetical protein